MERDAIQEMIDRTIGVVEGTNDNKFSSEDYMRYYTVVYNICSPNNFDECQRLYDLYKRVFEEYIQSKVLPSLQGKNDELLLQELAGRWSKYKVVDRWLERFFHYLNRYFVGMRKLPSLTETSFICFNELVYSEMNDKVKNAVFSMIDREREGEQIDQALVKNVIDIYVEMGMGSMELYEKDFEEAMLKDTTAFYSQKTSNWITKESYENYMIKADGCLKHERDTVSCYLPSRSHKKLLEAVEYELFSAYASELQQKNVAQGKAQDQ